jgi:hypothetical protein
MKPWKVFHPWNQSTLCFLIKKEQQQPMSDIGGVIILMFVWFFSSKYFY